MPLSLSMASLTLGSASVVQGLAAYLGPVATRGRVMDRKITTSKQLMSRTRHVARDDVTAVRLAFPNWYVTRQESTWIEAGTGGTATVTASVEYPSGTFTQVTFTGATSATVADGVTLVSDSIAVSIPKDTAFFVRVFFDGAVGMVFFGGAAEYPAVDTANGETMDYALSGVTDRTMGGTITNKSPYVSYGPCAVLGQTKKSSVYILGDSRCAGFNDLFDASGDLGEIARSVGPSLGYINGGVFGDQLALFVASHDRRLELANYCSHIIVESGFNDISGAGKTDLQTRALLATVKGYFPSKPVWLSTVSPATTSNNGWSDVAGQTILPGLVSGERQAHNDWRRTVPSSFAGCFEVADQVENVRNGGKWKAPGYTADGYHETQGGYLVVKNSGAINPALLTR